ncbi:fimbria/pilus periplasmic chaperone [Escherichia coli]|uniref:fimbria/pilus periplasmic chaperone n=1 Tax=Escherichia coli TaxID=562 RepID=UPI001B31A938|nr:fimbria/pilus periplasmic chaperone [Escherichia coli]MBP4021424.1 fimbria/pilus periplasmic chaperone [Escherichia coli]MCJ7910125.1 fimbria/pilus periplasmic chaperone [Escherichia coli]
MLFRYLCSFLFLIWWSISFTCLADESIPYPLDYRVHLQNKGDRLKGLLKIENPGGKAWLIQAWAEDDSGKVHSIVFPFLSRIEGQKSMVLTILQEPSPVIHLKWFVVKLIPSTGKENINGLIFPVIYKLKIVR